MKPENISVHKDIIIAGGGIAGLSLVLLLAKAGLNVALLEKYPPKTPPALSARTVALMNASLNILKGTGIWADVESASNPLRAMRIIDGSVARASVLENIFESDSLGLEQFGFNIPNNILRDALFAAALKTSGIAIHRSGFSSAVIQAHGIAVTLEDETIINGRLLVGADGARSSVRAHAGIEVKDHRYGQSAITCLIDHELPHNDTATEFHRPGGPFALVPLRGKVSSVVWVEKAERAEQLIRLKKEEFKQALQRETYDILGAIESVSNPETWPLSSLKAKTLVAPRIALIAEAAHVMSPITAQGLNLSLRDVAALAETIIDAARLGLDIGMESTLQKYQNRRMPDINMRTFGVDVMNRIVSDETSAIKNIRRSGFRTVSAFAPAKKFAMRHGLAPQIDLGRLARGEAL